MLTDLLNETQFIAENTDPCTVSDLKIDALLGESSAKILLAKPSVWTIEKRQEMFALLLEKPEKITKIRALNEQLCDCKRLYDASQESSHLAAKQYIFVALAAALCKFFRIAAENLQLGRLFDRFSASFAALIDEQRFSQVESTANALTDHTKTFQNLTVKIVGENMTVYRETTENYSEIFASCAEILGINLYTGRKNSIILQDAIVDAVAKLYPKQFAEISDFYKENHDYFDYKIFKYIPEFDFILSVFELTEKAKNAKIPYCFPKISAKKTLFFKNAYDISLIEKAEKIVPNDVFFDENEPFFYLTGANGGGKTTYLRAVGIATMLFLAGCPVFCEEGEASLLDSVFTHFPKDERFEGTGRFLDEQNRVDNILKLAKNNSLILLNETYSSTNEDKAVACTIELAKTIFSSGNFGLYITHQHGIEGEKPDTGTDLQPKIPFLSALIDETDSNRRTYKIERKRVAENSFAADILKKYNLSKIELTKRLKSKFSDQ